MRKTASLVPVIVALTAVMATSLWPQPSDSSSTSSWWWITEDKVPYVIIVIVAVVAFVFGSLVRPLLADAGKALLRWMQGWGKGGRFRQRYLNDVVSQNRHLALLLTNIVAAGWERRRWVELEDLYTPLSVGSGDRARDQDAMEALRFPSVEARWPLNGLRALWRRVHPAVRPSSGDIGETIRNHPRLVVSGDPGSGKTTLLRYLALSSARSLRNNRKDGDDPRIVRKRLGWDKKTFPILVPLNLLSDVTSWPNEMRLVDGIVRTLPGELRSRYPKGFFERELQKGNCLVMFDGFDELGSRAARGKMARLIANLADAYDHSENRFVVSTRVVGYEGQLDARGFTVHTVRALDDQAVRELVTRHHQAMAIGEGLGRSEQERADLRRRYEAQAGHLLADLERNEGLRALTTNPLLLSLIVLVRQVRPLPEERHILYRDCVEILTERWQARKRADAGLPAASGRDDLILSQKTELLQDIALSMQICRREGDGHTVIRREEVEAIVAGKLPDFISAHLPEDREQRLQECARRAGSLLDSIFEESGILVEKGLDPTGEPVVGFSHLTFQEYLTAAALRERPEKLPNLLDHLFDPAWREVLLLYVSIAQAGDVVQKCLEDTRQPLLVRYLLAGRCLDEGARVDEEQRRRVAGGLRAYLRPLEDADAQEIRDLYQRVSGVKACDWLIGNIANLLTEDERKKLDVPPGHAEGGALYRNMQETLRRLMEGAEEIETRHNLGCVLSGIGDPRDLDEMIDIPAGEFTMGSDSDEASRDEKPVHRVRLDAYAIGKYPVTNVQYECFVRAEGREPPGHWKDGKLQPWMANQPVVNVSWHDAQTYCRWLSKTTGRDYRLPSEAEWEKAARGSDKQIEWPWGNEFDQRRANTWEGRGDWTTTPVGLYPDGAGSYGVMDMAGNVWEWCSSLYRDYPYGADDGRESLEVEGTRVLRGGSWYFYSRGARCAYRCRHGPGPRYNLGGFRVAASPSSL